MARKKDERTDIQKAENRKDIAALYVRGVTQFQIAMQLGISQSTVCLDLKAIHAEWQREMLGNFDAHKAREREYWDAWKVSKNQREINLAGRETADAVIDSTGKPIGGRLKTKTQKRQEQRDGNPAFLSGLQWCIEMRCKIFGFYAPTKLTIEEMDRIINQLGVSESRQDGSADSAFIN
jgi:hypothetical protein